MNHDWLSLAKQQFPGWTVGGVGRFALHSPAFGKEFGKILLFETREECERNILDPKHAFCVDLMPATHCRIIPDAYDPEEARRERRERQNA
jgi:hypothetical protein